MNLEGLDFWGRPYVRTQLIPKGQMVSFWIAVVVPASAPAATYTTTATISLLMGSSSSSVMTFNVAVEIAVAGPPLDNGGDDDIWRGTRLHWFDSQLGNSDDFVPEPFVPLSCQTSGNEVTVSALEKVFVLDLANPFLSNVLTGKEGNQTKPLAAPVSFEVFAAGGPLQWNWQTEVGACSSMRLTLRATATLQGITASIVASLDATGE
jgi:hypothetical protein